MRSSWISYGVGYGNGNRSGVGRAGRVTSLEDIVMLVLNAYTLLSGTPIGSMGEVSGE